jgi:hypothetical protein
MIPVAMIMAIDLPQYVVPIFKLVPVPSQNLIRTKNSLFMLKIT